MSLIEKSRSAERVVKDFFITLEGHEHDAVDCLESLRAVRDDNVAIDPYLGDDLVKLEVLGTRGSSRGGYPAREGKRYDEFMAELEAVLEKEGYE